MATIQKINSFMQKVATKQHDLENDQFMVALTPAANPPLATNSQLSDLTVIAYTNLSSRILTVAGAIINTSGYKWTISDIILTASGGAVATFRYAAIYNNTHASKLLCGFVDYAANVTLGDGENFTLNFDDVNGLFQW